MNPYTLGSFFHALDARIRVNLNAKVLNSTMTVSTQKRDQKANFLYFLLKGTNSHGQAQIAMARTNSHGQDTFSHGPGEPLGGEASRFDVTHKSAGDYAKSVCSVDF